MKHLEKNLIGVDTDQGVYSLNRNKRILVRNSNSYFTKGQVKKAYTIIKNEYDYGRIIETDSDGFKYERNIFLNFVGNIKIGCTSFTPYQFKKICKAVMQMK
jgi:uncharacterized protein with GYD domain